MTVANGKRAVVGLVVLVGVLNIDGCEEVDESDKSLVNVFYKDGGGDSGGCSGGDEVELKKCRGRQE